VAINWRTDYAIRLMVEIARLGPGARDTVKRTAEAGGVPYDYARTIARDLAASGLLRSRRGVGGGVELGHAAEDISILDIFNAMGEPASMSLCTRGQVCDRTSSCAVHAGVWSGLDVAIVEYLARATLAESVELTDELQARA
jgi:Rrf2 family iron-sulfur cluster assembly transcriptional regulator